MNGAERAAFLSAYWPGVALLTVAYILLTAFRDFRDNFAAEAGFDYTCDLYHDDQPFPVRTRTGNLITVPYTVELNDVIVWRRGEEIDSFARQIKDHFDTVYAEGADQGRVMCIALHPFWVGQPHRIKGFQKVMEYILSHPGVWCATAGEIADHYRATQLNAVEAHLAARHA